MPLFFRQDTSLGMKVTISLRNLIFGLSLFGMLTLLSAIQAAKRPVTCSTSICDFVAREHDTFGAPSLMSKSAKPDTAKIYGKIQFVTSFPDYKVKVVDNFADLHVQIVNVFPDGPGKWQIVNSFPDYKIQLVESFPDFTIKFVNAFPGPK